jgi:hypothetical protein
MINAGGMEEQAVHDAEDGGIGADAEGEGENRDEREDRGFCQQANGVF